MMYVVKPVMVEQHHVTAIVKDKIPTVTSLIEEWIEVLLVGMFQFAMHQHFFFPHAFLYILHVLFNETILVVFCVFFVNNMAM